MILANYFFAKSNDHSYSQKISDKKIFTKNLETVDNPDIFFYVTELLECKFSGH